MSLGLLIGLGCGAKEPSARESLTSGRFPEATNFTLEDLEGRKISLSQYRGRVVFLDFWATWCQPCQATIPLVKRLAEKFSPDQVAVLGLNVDEDRSAVADFVKAFKIRYPVLLAGASEVSDRYGVRGIPTFVIIDQNGRIRRRFIGYHEGSEKLWDRLVSELVAAKSESSITKS